MKPLIVEEAKRRFGPEVNIKPLAELKSEEEKEKKENILVIGTVFKQQEKKPSILTELSEDAELEVKPEQTEDTEHTADSDTLVLEDETMREFLHTELLSPLTDKELDGIIAELHEDGSGTMDFDEFCEMTGELKYVHSSGEILLTGELQYFPVLSI